MCAGWAMVGGVCGRNLSVGRRTDRLASATRGLRMHAEADALAGMHMACWPLGLATSSSAHITNNCLARAIG